MLAFDWRFPLFLLKLTSIPFAEQQRKRGQESVESGNTRPPRRDCEKLRCSPADWAWVACWFLCNAGLYLQIGGRVGIESVWLGLVRRAPRALSLSHTHKQTLNLQSSFTLLAALPSLRFHSDAPRSAMQRRGAALRFNNSHCWERGRLPESSQASETHYYGAKWWIISKWSPRTPQQLNHQPGNYTSAI